MFDHVIGYRKMCYSRHELTMRFIEHNIKKYPLFEKILGFQYEINQKITPLYNARYDDAVNTQNYTRDDLAENATFLLCGYNIQYLFEAMVALEKDDRYVFANTIRPVYESIPKILYMLHRPEKVFYIACHDQYNSERPKIEYDYLAQNKNKKKKSMNTLEEFLKRVKQYPLAKGYNLNTKYVHEIFRSLSNQYYRNQVYSNESLKNQNYMYAFLSSSAHANIFRHDKIADNNLEKEDTYVKILSDLSFFNLYLQINICHNMLLELDEIADAVDFLKNVNEEIAERLAITVLYPQNPAYQKKLVVELI